MSHVIQVARSRPNQIGVPLPFRGIIKSTDAWLRHKEERMRDVTLSGFRNKIMSIYSAKIASDKDDDHFKLKRMKMGDFVHEWSILQTGNTRQAELELLETIESAKLFSSDMRVNLFSRLCGIVTEMPDDWTLPLEAVNFILDILFYLHEITHQEVVSLAVVFFVFPPSIHPSLPPLRFLSPSLSVILPLSFSLLHLLSP